MTDKDAWKRERPFRVAVIEQCTYDGTIYDAERIVERIGHLCDYIMFDEAWAGFMKFHPLYERRFAMGLKNLSEASPGIVATQSAHKQLASFSQASQIHVRDRHIKGQRRRVEHRRFNEGFMQFASTSPFYPLFASLDVGAQMMKGRSGEVLWDDTIRLGIELRKKLRAVRREFEEKERDPARRWFFDPFVPQRVSIRDAALEGATHDVPWENVSTDLLARDPRYWALAPGEVLARLPVARAGLRDHRSGQAHAAHAGLRPRDRRLRGAWRSRAGRRAISAREPGGGGEVRSQFAALPADPGRRVRARPARWFRRLSPSSGCTTTMLLLEDVMPEFVAKRPARYRGKRLRDLCGEMHAFFRDAGVSELQQAQFAAKHLPEMVMTPREASRHLVRNNVDYLPLDELEGRIATTLFVVYPPGIATIVPGERLTERARPMIDYLKMFEKSANVFPGFEAEVQGLYREVDETGAIRFYTYVVRETPA